MKLPLSWLKEIINLEESPEKIGEMLTLIGLEVDAITPLEKGDYLFEIAITPNLIHANSVYGVARELSALTGLSIKFPQVSSNGNIDADIDVVIEDQEKCPRYAAITFDIKVEESPKWLQERLQLAGFRPKNNVVDVTNYVMHELGHPLHAFDLDKIEGKKIKVRVAKKDEKITLLDDREVFLLADTLVIADASKPLAIAGVMGGKTAEVSEETSHVVVEAAYFQPSSVRRTAKKLGVATTASFYFERGTDPHILPTVLHRVATLLQDISKPQGFSKVFEKGETFKQRTLFCRVNRVNQILGTKLALNEVETIFKKLGFKIKREKDDTIEVSVPSFRNDIKEEIDLIEEVARLYGYDNIFEANRDVIYRGSIISHNPFYPYLKKVRFGLLTEGLQEVLTCNLIGPEEAALVSPSIFPSRSLIKILNPTSLAHSVMRPSLLPNALQVIKENVNHNILSIAAFEVGRIHFKTKDSFVEPTAMAVYLTGKRIPHHFGKKDEDYDFYDLKGIVENFLLGLKIRNIEFIPSSFSNFHPYRQAKINIGTKQEIGVMGELHPAFLASMGLTQPLYYAELNLDELYPLVKKDTKMKPLPLFPTSTRDWTYTLDRKYLVGDLLNLIYSIPSKILEEVMLLDVYQSDKLGSDVKNVTLRFIYRDLEKTVSFEEVEKEHERIIEKVLEGLKR